MRFPSRPLTANGALSMEGRYVDCPPAPGTTFWMPTAFEPMPFPHLIDLIGYDAVKAGLA